MEETPNIEAQHEVTPGRSYNMACIRGKDTKPEMIVRKFLWSRGFRYRLNHNRLPGKPDIVLRKYRTCIFVNGCFWHAHHLQLDNLKDPETRHSILETIQSSECCKITAKNQETGTGQDRQSLFLPMMSDSPCCRIPNTRREFWVAKIMRNQQRDIEVQKKLAEMGWHCVTVWECSLKPKEREKTLESLEYTLNKIYLEDHRLKRYELPEEERSLAAERDPLAGNLNAKRIY